MTVLDISSYLLVLATLRYSIRSLRGENLTHFLKTQNFQHLTFASLLVLFLLWSVKAGIKADLDIHFLGLTTLAMMYGWRFSHVLATTLTLVLVITDSISISALPRVLLLSVTLPILLSYTIFALSYHYLPRNVFSFIFIAGFFNGAANAAIHLAATAGYLNLANQYDWPILIDNYLALIPLVAFPEGLLNGMALAIMVVFKPEWVRVFSDRDYIYHPHDK